MKTHENKSQNTVNELVLTGKVSTPRGVNGRINNSILNTQLDEAVKEAFEKHGYELINLLRLI